MRKITTTFFTTVVISIIFTCLYMASRIKMENPYHLGSEFLGWFFIYSLYVGGIVVLYGNIVSVGLEYLQKKGLIKQTWLYVLLHGLFGLFSGFLFQTMELAVAGMVVALFYALIDRWLYVRKGRLKMFFLLPLVACGLLAGFFQVLSEPLPPFTMEDAVESLTYTSGNITDHFPKTVGKWTGMIDGYYVERETSATEIGEEKYIVTFTERWEKEEEQGSWVFSYNVERGSLSANGSEGEEPPYY